MTSTFRQQDVQTPHFKVPFRLSSVDNHAMVNEQDSDDDYMDCVKLIMGFPLGSREDDDTFGYPELLFAQLTTDEIVGRLHSAVQRWENRIDISVLLRAILDDGYRQQLELRVQIPQG